MPSDESKVQKEEKIDSAPKDMLPRVVSYKGLEITLSEGSAESYARVKELLDFINIIPGDNIEKFEWDFIFKSLSKENPILEEDESEFLFTYLDRSKMGAINKKFLRDSLVHVVRNGEWDGIDKPSNREIFRKFYEYSVKEQKQSHGIDYKLNLAVMQVKKRLGKLKRDIDSAKNHFDLINGAIEEGQLTLFADPQSIFDDQLKDHQKFLKQYEGGSFQKNYDSVKKMLYEAKKNYAVVNAQLNALRELKENDSKCCKFFGCLCPC